MGRGCAYEETGLADEIGCCPREWHHRVSRGKIRESWLDLIITIRRWIGTIHGNINSKLGGVSHFLRPLERSSRKRQVALPDCTENYETKPISFNGCYIMIWTSIGCLYDAQCLSCPFHQLCSVDPPRSGPEWQERLSEPGHGYLTRIIHGGPGFVLASAA